jgi:alkylation response protein AidB-like acyl-CoA dehydrogenase
MLVLNEDQTLLAETAREFVASTDPLARLRKLRDAGDPLGYSPDVWRKLADLGWTAMPFTEADGGLGLGMADVVVVTEALGRLLAPEPFVPCVVLAGSCLAEGGSAAQKQELLASLIAGTARVALAHDEKGARGDLYLTRTAARETALGFRITGEKVPVLGGAGAAAFLVVARTSGEERDHDGLTVLVVPAGAPGLRVTPLRRVDCLNAAVVALDGVEVPASAVVGQVGKGGALLEKAVDRATVALSAEMLGAMGEALARTLTYLREREQFGVKIGSFQALQHRAARLFIEVELSRSAVLAASHALDEGAPNGRELVSVAKARCSDAFVLVANEAVQMHGGIGMTDEHDLGFFLKRAKAAELTFGDAAWHRARLAGERGF